MRERVKKMVFIHHDPAATDEKIQKVEQQTRSYHESAIRMAKEQGLDSNKFEWCFGAEGMAFEI
jgi:hypothetical protein